MREAESTETGGEIGLADLAAGREFAADDRLGKLREQAVAGRGAVGHRRSLVRATMRRQSEVSTMRRSPAGYAVVSVSYSG
jgi:hypothetical protein